MAEHNGEEYLNSPTDDSSENISDNITTNSHTETTNPETNNMEVHHAHHPTHKKKWTEYLLEFFMLFFAVFLGFLAENIREHQIEKAKEKEYMVSMLSDLKNDTFSIDNAIYGNKILIAGQDSALHFLSANLNNQDTASMAFIYFFKYCVNLSFVRISDGTITQLKNNGGLRLIRDKEVIEKINSYYIQSASLINTESIIKDFLTINGRQAGEIFNCITNINFIDSINLTQMSSVQIPIIQLKKWLPEKKQFMLTTDAKSLSPIINNISYQMGLMGGYVSGLKYKKKAAMKLMQTIKKNYHLEKE